MDEEHRGRFLRKLHEATNVSIPTSQEYQRIVACLSEDYSGEKNRNKYYLRKRFEVVSVAGQKKSDQGKSLNGFDFNPPRFVCVQLQCHRTGTMFLPSACFLSIVGLVRSLFTLWFVYQKI